MAHHLTSRSAAKAAALLAASLLTLTACTTAVAGPSPSAADTPRPGAAGIGDTLHPGLGNGGYDVDHYRLDLRFAEDLKTYTATTTLRARTTRALSRFNLDLTGTQVRDVQVDGHRARWSRSEGELRVTPPSSLPRATEFTVRVRVRAEVPDTEQAGQLGTTAIGMVRHGSWIQTINQPSGAHRIAALADHPAQKAPATVTIAAPTRLNSIANGELTDSRREDGYTVRRFDSRQKLAPELLQIGVGPFTVTRDRGPHGTVLRNALPKDRVEELQPQLSATVPEALDFFEERLGTFPLRTYGVYATPLGGSLETQSLTILAEDELTAESFRDNGTDAVVAHEIAHEYFGNSVSPRRWSDLWLSEGHAVYYQTAWSEEHGAETLEQTMRENYQEANAVLRAEGPVAAPRKGAFDPADMAPYGDAAYQGGALVLYALRQKVGAADFERIERAWVHEYRDSTAGTDDFIRLAGRVTGRDLGPFLRSWLYADTVPAMPGHPDWRA